jgi:CRP-like cAMP-binding protein
MNKKPLYLKTYLSTPGSHRTIERLKRNQVLFGQGKRADAIFYILTGVVGLTVTADGKERIIALLGPGSFAGKECMASKRPKRTCSGRALTACTVLRIERNEVLHMIKTRRTFAVLIVDYLLSRITRYQEVIMDQMFVSSEKRLARTLLQLTNMSESGNVEVVVPYLGQTILAEVVGTTRSRVSFFMNRFRVLGLIAYKSQSPVLINATRLSAWLVDGCQIAPVAQGQDGQPADGAQ